MKLDYKLKGINFPTVSDTGTDTVKFVFLNFIPFVAIEQSWAS